MSPVQPGVGTVCTGVVAVRSGPGPVTGWGIVERPTSGNLRRAFACLGLVVFGFGLTITGLGLTITGLALAVTSVVLAVTSVVQAVRALSPTVTVARTGFTVAGTGFTFAGFSFADAGLALADACLAFPAAGLGLDRTFTSQCRTVADLGLLVTAVGLAVTFLCIVIACVLGRLFRRERSVVSKHRGRDAPEGASPHAPQSSVLLVSSRSRTRAADVPFCLAWQRRDGQSETRQRWMR